MSNKGRLIVLFYKIQVFDNTKALRIGAAEGAARARVCKELTAEIDEGTINNVRDVPGLYRTMLRRFEVRFRSEADSIAEELAKAERGG
jgi:hypothetical protein